MADSKPNGDDVMEIDQNLLIDAKLLSIGTMISGGHYSKVYQGLYNSMPVAIKVLQPTKTSAVSPERKEQFQREVTMLAKVRHENIVKFIGACLEPSMMIITELVKGYTLQEYLWSIHPTCPDLKLSMSFALKIARAMAYLHGIGIIHRGLKPTNLLLTEDKQQIKVAAFGLARNEAEDAMTTEAGTYPWMAPELFSMEPIMKGVKKHYDRKVDVYSFSFVFWELLTNTTPYKGKGNILVADAASYNERPSLENLPKDIVPLLQSCWEEDPAHRPEFMQISYFLANLLYSFSSPWTSPPEWLHTPRRNAMRQTIIKSGEKGNKKARTPSLFFCCTPPVWLQNPKSNAMEATVGTRQTIKKSGEKVDEFTKEVTSTSRPQMDTLIPNSARVDAMEANQNCLKFMMIGNFIFSGIVLMFVVVVIVVLLLK